jgi:hypothetical protein
MLGYEYFDSNITIFIAVLCPQLSGSNPLVVPSIDFKQPLWVYTHT